MEKDELSIQLGVIRKILDASEEDIRDYDFLFECIAEYGVYPYPQTMRYYPDNVRYTENGILQAPGEFVSFCQFLSGLKHMDSALEVGVYRGRSSYLMCAMLYRRNRNLKYYMADIVDRLDGFEAFEKLLPVEKKVPETSRSFRGQTFDFVFIDADHSYNGSMEDFINVGQYARRVVCFHDIYDHNYDKSDGGTVRTWWEFCRYSRSFMTRTFARFPQEWMGIGVGVRESRGMTDDEEFGEKLDRLKREKAEFFSFIREHQEIYIYGTGYYGTMLADIINRESRKISGYVVSDGRKQEEVLRGMRVFTLSEAAAMEKKNQAGFILALQECHQADIGNALRESGFCHIFYTGSELLAAIIDDRAERPAGR